ncbi:FAD-dependent monooxygenase fsr3 [Paramyrothecium foliicola]|nr:FAD-dependent monooxygenase fsr3 [Paramyrothecium foliicola]
MKRYPASGISILVAGAGIAGLGFAIEAYRKGHDVRIIEKRPLFEDFGDIIAIQTPALHTPKKWPGFLERLDKHSYTPISYTKKFDGSLIGTQPLGRPDIPTLVTNRSQLHKLLHDYVVELGIQVEFSAAVKEYFEEGEFGGVVLEDGRRILADLVVAADGAGSRSCHLVIGRKEVAISSGFAVYRVTFPVGPALENPVIAEEFKGFDNRVSVHIGPGAHVVIGKTPDQICWVLTHKDEGNANEDWTALASTDKALVYVKDWCPFITELINATPNKTCTDWKLMWRNPISTWTSPGGRIIQIGDAAHTFLPTSGSGATMALEDAFSLASCLQISGKGNIPLSVRVHNHMRFVRASCGQKMGFKNRENFHNTDWDAAAAKPQDVTKTVGDWVLNHNPEQYAYDNYAKCANHLLMGEPFVNTNAPPGYVFKPWTVKELIDASEKGIKIVDEGDCSSPYISNGNPRKVSLTPQQLPHTESQRYSLEERWIDRCWYLGDSPPKLLGQIEGSTVQSPLDVDNTQKQELIVLDQTFFDLDSHTQDDIDLNSLADDTVESTSLVEESGQNQSNFPSLGVLLNSSLAKSNSPMFHPPVSQIPFYWQTFVENVDPIIKIFHIPTISKVIREIQSRIPSLEPVEEALIYAVFFAVVTSMAPDEASHERTTLLAHYRAGAEQGFARADLLSNPNLFTLQAFVLFAHCLRQSDQTRTAWNLAALAVRMGQGLQLHQPDKGLGLSPFESENRRRLWLSIWLLDISLAVDYGNEPLICGGINHGNLPSNVNDSSFDETSTGLANEREPATVMMHTLIRHELGTCFKKLVHERKRIRLSFSPQIDLQTMEDILAECRSTVQEKYLRYNSGDGPLQWMIAASTRMFFAKTSLLMYEPVLPHTSRSSLPRTVKNRLVAASLEIVQCAHDLETKTALNRRGRWFCTYPYWYAVTLILENLPPDAENSERYWTAIEIAQGYVASASMNRRNSRPWQLLARAIRRAQEKRRLSSSGTPTQQETSYLETVEDSAVAEDPPLEQAPVPWPGTAFSSMESHLESTWPLSVDVTETSYANFDTDEWLNEVLQREL